MFNTVILLVLADACTDRATLSAIVYLALSGVHHLSRHFSKKNEARATVPGKPSIAWFF